jgi:hypothetical protein
MRALLGLPLLAGLGALLYRGPSMRSLAVTPATVPAACGRHCGVERWSVKTLSDRDRGRVNFRPRPTTVAALAALERPVFLPEGGRAKPVERTTFVLRAYLAGWQPENDGDIHLILADPDQQTVTMIAEIPDPECAGGWDRWRCPPPTNRFEGSPLRAARVGSIPTQLAEALRDRYVLDRELGRWGMATVYLAHDLKHDRFAP